MDKPDDETIAKMLRCPEGELGKKVAENMNRSNYHLIRWAVESLALKAGDAVLEIGFGNGAHIKDIIAGTPNLRFTGVDISPDMIKEASGLLQDEIRGKQVALHRVSSDDLPFPHHVFDRVLTVNTLYFWEEPSRHLEQIRKVLRPEGVFCLAIRTSDFMKELPFVRYGFKIYSPDEAESLLVSNGFRILEIEKKKEAVQIMQGREISPEDLIITAKKESSL